MSPRELLRLAEQAIREADRLSERFSRALQSVFNETERALRPILASTSNSPTSIARTLPEMRQALRKSGFDALADLAYGERLDPMIRKLQASRRLFGLSSTLTESQRLQLDALGSLYKTDLLGEGDTTARVLWRTAARGIWGGTHPDDLLTELGRVLDKSTPQIRTLYDTSVSILGRQVEALQAGDDPDTKFALLGPVDDKMRPWCREHVGKVFTRQEIDDMDNGQITPVFLTGGGYNCRHVWNEVSAASELYDYDQHDRIPEIQHDLDTLKTAA